MYLVINSHVLKLKIVVAFFLSLGSYLLMLSLSLKGADDLVGFVLL
jgi:hypothetical protein